MQMGELYLQRLRRSSMAARMELWQHRLELAMLLLDGIHLQRAVRKLLRQLKFHNIKIIRFMLIGMSIVIH